MSMKEKIEGMTDKAIGFAKNTGHEIDIHSPKILFVTGTVALVGFGIWMRKAALKEYDIIAPTKARIEEIHSAAVIDANGKPEYTEEQKQALTGAYVQLVKDEVKIYSGPVIVGVVSFTSFLASLKILDTRLSDTTAAFSALMASQRAIENRAKVYLSDDDYRRVINGEQVKTEQTVNPETGEVQQTKVITPAEDTSLLYVRYWNKDCKRWLRSGPDYNLMLLKDALDACNRKLDRDGVLWYAEVLEMLGYPVTKGSRVVCWKKKPGMVRQVSFGQELEDILAGRNNEFKHAWYDLSGKSYPSIRLEFNVDGSSYWESGMQEA